MAALSILHVSQPTVAGVARVVADLSTDQARRGWRVGVACPPDGDLAGWVADAGARHLEWRAARGPGLSTFSEGASLKRAIASYRPDIVHLHSSKAGLAGRLVVRGEIPTLFQPHAWSFEAVAGPIAAATRAWERFAARWTTAILCVSEEEREAGERIGIRARWEVVPNGVDLSKFPATDADRRMSARRTLGFGDEPTVVCVGRLSEQKGQDILLEVWPGVTARVPQAILYLVGDGPLRSDLEARSIPGVVLLGRRGDVAEVLAAANLVAMPSRWEGCSLAMLEALASGRSVVAFDVPGSREAIGTDAGEVVPKGDIGAFVDAIVKRLHDPEAADREGERGRERVEERHDLRRSTASVAGLSEAIVAQAADTSS